MTESIPARPGTVVDGWRKQRGGHWYDGETRTRAALTDEGVEIHSTAGHQGVPVPVEVIQDLLDQDIPRTTP